MATLYIDRTISAAIIEAAKYFPVVTLTGPRQSGKSTLLRHLFPEMPYFSMEDLDIRQAAKDDPRGFLGQFAGGVIIDEVQRVPELLSYIQGIVDNDPERKFYLTGSAQFALLKDVSQTLAGRSAVFELLPLSLEEISKEAAGANLDELIFRGFYPAIWSGKNVPKYFYPGYVKTYVERDIRTMLAVKDLDLFQRFLRLCAARIGSIFNASEISNELGVSVNTINSWISILQASYLIFLLPPFYANTRKRLTKSPKLYFVDTGLAAYLLEMDSPEIVGRDKMRGHLFENMVIVEFMKNRFNEGKSGGLYFYRDSNAMEVDLLIKSGSKYDLCEIKSSSTFHPDFIKGITSFEKTFPNLISKKTVIYTGPEIPSYKEVDIKKFM